MHTRTQCLLSCALGYYAPAFSEIAYGAKAPTEILCLLNGLLWRRNISAEINRRNKVEKKVLKYIFANIFHKSVHVIFFPKWLCIFVVVGFFANLCFSFAGEVIGLTYDNWVWPH